jgi:periplasmic protein TonB
VRRTRPEPISQPLPDLNVDGTARFRLQIGTDGRVKEVTVLESIPGATPRLISSIQRWRFKPATENGRAVEGTHIVDLSFKARND